VFPLLVEDGLQAPAHREALRLGVTRLGDRDRDAGQRLVGQADQHLADGGHPVCAQGEHLLQRRARVWVARDAGLVGHLVVGQVERVPRRRLAQDRAVHPGVGGEDQVAKRLDEGPLPVDPLVQQLRGHPAGSRDGLPPQPFQDVPGVAEPVGVGRAHLGPVRVTAIQLGLHQGHDVDPVDPQVTDPSADIHVDQGRAADRHPGQVDEVEARAGQGDVSELGAVQVHALEPGTGQVLVDKVSHPTSLA
jgi:hypothetical protein